MVNDPSLLGPVFPAELEKTIFEITAQARPLAIPILMRVAWRVKIWLEPLLYRTIAIAASEEELDLNKFPWHSRWEPLVSLMENKRRSAFKEWARHLLLAPSSVPPHAAKIFLTVCSRVEDLWINVDDMAELLALLRSLPLKRLYCHLMEIFPLARVDFTDRMFSQITHLEVFDQVPAEKLPAWGGLGFIPRLTHLAFNFAHFLPICLELLDSCKSLQVLVILEERPARSEDWVGLDDLAKDPRFVSMHCGKYFWDWQMGAHMGIDYWSEAEDFIRKRCSGELARLQYRIPAEFDHIS
ncbi:hypothetical protein C8R43DRAFT_1028178 [Mycena crocata]|nr:hypothetical protein C8R43DRAFT_1028178 [Mycena crocata]